MAAACDVVDFASAHEFLVARINYERTAQIPYASTEFKLDRMRRLLARLGDPHLGLKAVHIAGTKGKGSTAAMIAAVLMASGRKTGLYTSPHLARIEERMAIDGQLCTESQFISIAAGVQQAVQRLEQEAGAADPDAASPTFFEVTTAMAFLHFARENVAAAVLEVGLGGRLDSTNVCRPEVCAITSISFDHMKQLGDTLAAIAGEKAGIIKPGVPVVSGVLLDEPRSVIAEQARLLGAPLFQRGVDFDFARQAEQPTNGAPQAKTEFAERFAYREPARTPRLTLEGLRLSLLGMHQAANAACAVAAVLRLNERGWSVTEGAIREGLAAARSPARIELVPGPPEAIIDVAHNPASVEALLDVLDERFAGRRKTLIFASSRDKDYAGMLRLLAGRFETIVLTRYTINPRAVEAEELQALLRDLLGRSSDGGRVLPRIEIASDPAAAWQNAAENAIAGELICITGSFFLAAELRPLLVATKVEAGPDGVPAAAS